MGALVLRLRISVEMLRMLHMELIGAAKVAGNLLTVVNTPVNERQARELAQLSPEHQREVAATIDCEHNCAETNTRFRV